MHHLSGSDSIHYMEQVRNVASAKKWRTPPAPIPLFRVLHVHRYQPSQLSLSLLIFLRYGLSKRKILTVCPKVSRRECWGQSATFFIRLSNETCQPGNKVRLSWPFKDKHQQLLRKCMIVKNGNKGREKENACVAWKMWENEWLRRISWHFYRRAHKCVQSTA